MKLAKNLRYLRLKNGLSQDYICEIQLGICKKDLLAQTVTNTGISIVSL